MFFEIVINVLHPRFHTGRSGMDHRLLGTQQVMMERAD